MLVGWATPQLIRKVSWSDAYPLTHIATRGVRYTGLVEVEIQGWLRAKEACRYQLVVDVSAHFGSSYTGPTCFLQAWLENRSLDQRTALVSPASSNTKDANATLVLGAELQPGLYRLRIWTVCLEPQGVTTAVELLLKALSELNLRPAAGTDFFITKANSSLYRGFGPWELLRISTGCGHLSCRMRLLVSVTL